MVIRRWFAGVGAVGLGALLGGFGSAAPASAHAVLVSSNPAAGSIVLNAPTQVVLRFTEPVTLVVGKFRVLAPDSSRADTGEPNASGDQVVIAMKPGGRRGTYLVTFRVISADSHPVGGSFSYSVVSPSAAPAPDNISVTANPLVSTLFPVVRWVGYVGLVLMVGAVLVLALLWPPRLGNRGPVMMIWSSAGLIAVATIGEMAAQIPNVAGGFGDVGSADVRAVLSSQYGTAHVIRLAALAATLVLLRPIIKGTGWGVDRVLLPTVGTIAVDTWSVAGHPYASPEPAVTVVADMVHIASMSVWLGGLIMLAVFLLPRASAAELGAVVPVWSRWAACAVGALLLSGVVQALVEVDSVAALFTTNYGRLVLAKAVLFGVVLLIAFYSRRMIGLIVAKSDGAVRRLRSLVVAESAGAVVIIAIAAVLVQTTPARSPAASAPPPTVQSAVLAAPSRLFTLTVDETPARVGPNEVHMYVTTADGRAASVQEWTVSAALASRGIEPITVPVRALESDHGIGQVMLPAAGVWRFTFTLRTSDLEEDAVTTTFTIAS